MYKIALPAAAQRADDEFHFKKNQEQGISDKMAIE